jgi:hypothetical protein
MRGTCRIIFVWLFIHFNRSLDSGVGLAAGPDVEMGYSNRASTVNARLQYRAPTVSMTVAIVEMEFCASASLSNPSSHLSVHEKKETEGERRRRKRGIRACRRSSCRSSLNPVRCHLLSVFPINLPFPRCPWWIWYVRSRLSRREGWNSKNLLALEERDGRREEKKGVDAVRFVGVLAGFA